MKDCGSSEKSSWKKSVAYVSVALAVVLLGFTARSYYPHIASWWQSSKSEVPPSHEPPSLYRPIVVTLEDNFKKIVLTREWQRIEFEEVGYWFVEHSGADVEVKWNSLERPTVLRSGPPTKEGRINDVSNISRKEGPPNWIRTTSKSHTVLVWVEKKKRRER